jgi:hypothetical protein
MWRTVLVFCVLAAGWSHAHVPNPGLFDEETDNIVQDVSIAAGVLSFASFSLLILSILAAFLPFFFSFFFFFLFLSLPLFLDRVNMFIDQVRRRARQYRLRAQKWLEFQASQQNRFFEEQVGFFCFFWVCSPSPSAKLIFLSSPTGRQGGRCGGEVPR